MISVNYDDARESFWNPVQKSSCWRDSASQAFMEGIGQTNFQVMTPLEDLKEGPGMSPVH